MVACCSQFIGVLQLADTAKILIAGQADDAIVVIY